MRTAVREALVVSCLLALGAGVVQAETGKPAPQAKPATPQAKPAASQGKPMSSPSGSSTAGASMGAASPEAMAAMQQATSPGAEHRALEPFVGTWNYTLQWWMEPGGAPQSMSGTTTNRWIFGGRFLQQEVRGPGMMEGQPPFEGIGYTGYDNIGKQYQTVWIDNMATGMSTATGNYDPATQTFAQQGNMSCPMTGEAHRPFRAVWKVVDPTHNTYESWMRSPDGAEFKAMEIQYTKQ